MKKQLSHLALTLSLLLCAAFPAFAMETYTLDPAHSYVLWYINHLGFSNQSGKWMVAGTLQLDKAHPTDSKVDVTINIDTMITGNAELDKHLKGALFFNTQEFKTATFVSNKVILTGKKTAKVEGMLTLHGVTKPVVLNVTFNNEGKNPITDKMTVGFSATANIKRSAFNMTTLLPKLGDDVKLQIEAEAYANS